MMTPAYGYLWMLPGIAQHDERLHEAKVKMEAYCSAHGLAFRELIADQGFLAPATARPEFGRLLGRREAGEFILVFDSLRSLGRRFHDVVLVLNELEQRGIPFISIEEDINSTTDNGRLLFQTLLRLPQVAKWLKGTPREEAPVHSRAKEVMYNGGACPYGYAIDEATNQYRVMQAEAIIVRRIFSERAAGRSLRQIAGDLSKEGVPTKRGGRWQANTVKTILENIFYTGAYLCQGKLYPNDHEAIVSERVFRSVGNETDGILVQAS